MLIVPTPLMICAGITGMEIETVEIRFTAIGFYAEPTISEHLQNWKGKPVAELTEDDSGFHKELIQGTKKSLGTTFPVSNGLKGASALEARNL